MRITRSVKTAGKQYHAVAEPILIDDGSGCLKEAFSGEILDDEYEFGEGFEEEQEIVKDIASKINIPKA